MGEADDSDSTNPDTPNPENHDNTFERIAQMLDFPAEFPIKVMGNQHELFVQSITELVTKHIEDFDAASIVETSSRTGKFISLTVSVQVTSREQLQSLYEALADHKLVRIVL
ncbi:MAG: DUF493 domain-containing protein [Burkholderiaceae bacterium]